ncbi:hypothetical protein Poly59_58270 [Rubripirellula reticaptiva]|uniref:Uncharacterized protein n=1 Tax=Rubripirellula reticaptiva TaxID=2528013 RepID=A0A5C6EEL5_9BACT|nr:hypothetical protein Poly59_58270 [Rubripirellula reticaptiva]
MSGEFYQPTKRCTTRNEYQSTDVESHNELRYQKQGT